jgi:hypothetical protein
VTTPLTATDLHIAQLLTGGVSVQRILAIGRYRASWGPDDVAYVHAWLAARARPQPECGTAEGWALHRQRHERVCDDCRAARCKDEAS